MSEPSVHISQLRAAVEHGFGVRMQNFTRSDTSNAHISYMRELCWMTKNTDAYGLE